VGAGGGRGPEPSGSVATRGSRSRRRMSSRCQAAAWPSSQWLHRTTWRAARNPLSREAGLCGRARFEGRSHSAHRQDALKMSLLPSKHCRRRTNQLSALTQPAIRSPHWPVHSCLRLHAAPAILLVSQAAPAYALAPQLIQSHDRLEPAAGERLDACPTCAACHGQVPRPGKPTTKDGCSSSLPSHLPIAKRARLLNS